MGRHAWTPKERELVVALSKRLFTARQVAGLTQREIAEQIGVTRAAVSMVEIGKAAPTVPLLILWARALGASVDSLVEGL